MSKSEDAFSTRLCDFLEENGIESTTQKRTADGKWLDIFCTVDDIAVAIEAKHGTSKIDKKNAIDDADSRLDNNYCDLAVAVCYPSEYQTAKDLREGHLFCNIRKREEKDIGRWQKVAVTTFSGYLKEVVQDIKSPEDLAKRVGIAVRKAEASLSSAQKSDLLKKMESYIKVAKSQAKTETEVDGLMTDLLTAIMFHSKLDAISREFNFSGEQPIPLDECLRQEDSVHALKQSHEIWLEIDYRQIFAWSCELLSKLPLHQNSQRAVKILIENALAIQRLSGNSHHHDLIGITFCQSLKNAKYDGSFYTTLPASTLLVNLLMDNLEIDWGNFEQITQLRIVDFACGTGTLLIAVAKYILDKEQTNRKDEIARALLEQMLYGFDINTRAIFQSATGLGMIAPDVIFKKMHLYSMILGLDEEDQAILGSLALLNVQSQQSQRSTSDWDKVFLALQNPPPKAQRIDNEAVPFEANEFDIAIMNPPFTANKKRHQHLDQRTKKKLQAKEQQVFQELPAEITSNANAFLVLAERWLKNHTGLLGVIIPLATATGLSAFKVRKYLAKQFHIKYIIVPHDVKRTYFSGNTQIHELIVIMERYTKKNMNLPTKIIKLSENPSKSSDARIIGDKINLDQLEEDDGIIDVIPKNFIMKGDWRAILFMNNELFKIASHINNTWGSNIKEQIDIEPAPRDIYKQFEKKNIKHCKAGDYGAIGLLDNHNVELMCYKLEITPDKHVCTHHVGFENTLSVVDKLTNNQLLQANHLKLATQIRLTSNKVMVCRTAQKSVSTRWHGGKLKITNANCSNEDLEKIIAIILNSTFGKLGIILNKHNDKVHSYFILPKDNLEKIPLPQLMKLESRQISILLDAYHRLLNQEKLILSESFKCPIQKSIDESTCEALGLNPQICEKARHLLSQEPMVAG